MLLGFDFDRLRSGPFEGPAIVKPPALPGGYLLVYLVSLAYLVFLVSLSGMVETPRLEAK
jgi:hypothetical protein